MALNQFKNNNVMLDPREGTTRQHGGDGRSKNGQIKSDNIMLDSRQGTSKKYLLERLKNQRPDLFKLVKAGKLSTQKRGCLN
jgi:hypothetical protein